MASDNRFTKALRAAWLRLRGNHPGTRLISLLLAVLLWVIIAVTQNPMRTARVLIPYERIQFLGASDLVARRMSIADDLAELLGKGVEVYFEVPQSNYSMLTTDTVSVSIDLSGQEKPGEAVVHVRAETSVPEATVIRVAPDAIRLNIDEYATKEFSVALSIEGTPADGHIAGDAVLEEGGKLLIEGPKTIVAAITSARAVMNIEGATADQYQTLEITLLDAEGNPIGEGNLTLSMDSMRVELPIYVTRNVALAPYVNNLTTGEPLPEYELIGVDSAPSVVTVAAPADMIDEACRIMFSPISIEGAEETIRDAIEIIQPRKGFITPGIISVTAVIRERTRPRLFTDCAIDIVGLSDGLIAAVVPGTVDARIVGTLTVMRDFRQEDLRLYVDLAGKGPGAYVIVPDYSASGATGLDVRFERDGVSLSAVTVTITEAAP